VHVLWLLYAPVDASALSRTQTPPFSTALDYTIASPTRGRKGLETLARFSCAFGMQLKLWSHDWNFIVICNFCSLVILKFARLID
jgi:hypothetical protein